jgi:uncharacterized linocin/CFP29 family protein
MFGRDKAPISAAAFGEIDAQAARTLRANLAARKFVDVKGPYGWAYSGVSKGSLESVGHEGGVGYGVRAVAPLVEARVDFDLSSFELHNIDRGSVNPDLTPVEHAAAEVAAFEDRVVFEGFERAAIKGFKCAQENPAIELPANDPGVFLKGIIGAVGKSNKEHSISGPFALIGGDELREVLSALAGQRTLMGLIKEYTDVDEFVYAPNAPEAYLASKRGGDFELVLGSDFAIGYSSKDGDSLKFFITESFSFRILEPRAYTQIKVR